MTLEAVVLAAGEGRRMRPLTEIWPKPLLPIDGRPVIATLLRELEFAERITVVTGSLGDRLRRFLDGWDVAFAHQPAVLGSADAAPLASKKSEEAVYGPRSRPRPGVGSNGSQPYPSNQTSTQVCAFVSETVHSRESAS